MNIYGSKYNQNGLQELCCQSREHFVNVIFVQLRIVITRERVPVEEKTSWNVGCSHFNFLTIGKYGFQESLKECVFLSLQY